MKQVTQGSAILVVLILLVSMMTAWHAVHLQVRLGIQALHYFKRRQSIFWLSEGLCVYGVALCKQHYDMCMGRLHKHKEIVGVVDPWPLQDAGTQNMKGELRISLVEKDGIELHARLYALDKVVGHAQCICGYNADGNWSVSAWNYTQQ